MGKVAKAVAGCLYVVTTPIGNLGDLTPRAAETLAAADFVAAEDTRVTVKLLNHLGLKKPMVSYHEHNERSRTVQILDRVAAGESCALCSDAGMPAISDPGETVVKEALARGLSVVPVPGASAALTALCVSGQDTSRFVFEGFLSQNRGQRRQRLLALAAEERTMIFYEAPHKLLRTLGDLCEAFGPGRGATLCRELTKRHEEICITTLGEAGQRYAEDAPRGEFVLVVAGAQKQTGPTASPEEAGEMARQLAQEEGISASEAARRVAGEVGLAKSEVYRAMQKR